MFSLLHYIDKKQLDPVYMHLHHADSLKLLEKGRLTLLSLIGYSAESLIESGLYPVITSIDVEYLREVKEGPYTICCDRFKAEERELIIHQSLRNDRGKVAVQAVVRSVLLHKERGRAVRPPVELARIFTNLTSA